MPFFHGKAFARRLDCIQQLAEACNTVRGQSERPLHSVKGGLDGRAFENSSPILKWECPLNNLADYVTWEDIAPLKVFDRLSILLQPGGIQVLAHSSKRLQSLSLS